MAHVNEEVLENIDISPFAGEENEEFQYFPVMSMKWLHIQISHIGSRNLVKCSDG